MRPSPPSLFLAFLVILASSHLLIGPFLYADQYRSRTSGVWKATTEKKTIEGLEKSLKDLEEDPYAKALAARNLAHAHLREKDYAKTIVYLEQAIATKSLSSYAEQDMLLELAQVYMAADQPQNVVDTLGKWFPNAHKVDSQAYLLLANAYVELEQYEKAVDPLEEALKQSETVEEDWYRLLLSVHYKLRHFESCIHVLKEMIRLFPTHSDYYVQLSSLYTKMGKSNQALSVMELAYKSNKFTRSEDLVLLAQQFLVNNVPYKAGVLLENCLKNGQIEESVETLELLAMAWMQAKERALAVPPLQRALQASDKDEYHLWLAQLSMDMRNWEEAILVIEKALAKAHRAKKSYDRARADPSRSHSLKMPLLLEKMGKLYLLLGIAHYELSETSLARQAFLKASQIGGAMKQASDWLAYLDSDLRSPENEEGVQGIDAADRDGSGISEFQTAELMDTESLGVPPAKASWDEAGLGETVFRDDDLHGPGALTPIGAVAAGNETGDIPPYEGAAGLTCPEGFVKGDFLPNPYADEEPLFRIDHTNAHEYKQRLSPAQEARLNLAHHYYMDIYPTHRNYEFHEKVLHATRESAKTTHLDGNLQLIGYKGGIPFCEPQNGIEAICNARRADAIFDLSGVYASRSVAPSGSIVEESWKYEAIIFDEDMRLLGKKIANPHNVAFKNMYRILRSPSKEGFIILTIRYLDDDKPIDTWGYIPQFRLVRRGPPSIFDRSRNLTRSATIDDILPYQESVTDWDWKLLGRKEMYIPANNYEMWRPGTTVEEMCPPLSVNPKDIRYELRRVWVVAGTPRGNYEHPYSRRLRYFDEDSWLQVMSANYDQEGEVLGLAEMFVSYDYCNKFSYFTGSTIVNLQTGDYDVLSIDLSDDARMPVCNSGLDPDKFTRQALKKAGR
jgi:tetratricopeptide (TPR) repeat protein